jgi:hypothetical protein
MKGIMKPTTVIGSAAFLGVMLAIGFGLVPFFYLTDPSAFEAWFADASGATRCWVSFLFMQSPRPFTCP